MIFRSDGRLPHSHGWGSFFAKREDLNGSDLEREGDIGRFLSVADLGYQPERQMRTHLGKGAVRVPVDPRRRFIDALSKKD